MAMDRSFSTSSEIPSARERLATRIESKEAIVAVVGLGYVGLPIAHAIHGCGLRVIAFDVDSSKVDSLNAGNVYLRHLGEELPRELARSDHFEATTKFERLSEPDVVIVCVPTPLRPHREPDLGYILSTASSIGECLRAGQLLILESTTYPGTTREVFLPAVLEASARQGDRLEPGEDFFVAYSPEREDPGRQSHSMRTTPRVVGGIDAASTELARQLYGHCVDEVRAVGSSEVAEAAKLLENVFRSVNIALVNELKVIFEELGIDVWEVIDAAASKPFGFMPFYPGPGLGGHCIPIDPFYLSWKAKEVGRPTRFIELAGEINTEMPAYVMSRVTLALNSWGKAVRGCRALVLGLAYKPDVDDTRESPSFDLIQRLRSMGAHVDYSDPHVPRTPAVRKHDLQMVSVALTPDSLESYDVVLIVTAHGSFDYAQVADHAQLVVDTRNSMSPYAERMGQRLVRA